jgi:hypothetical protein
MCLKIIEHFEDDGDLSRRLPERERDCSNRSALRYPKSLPMGKDELEQPRQQWETKREKD